MQTSQELTKSERARGAFYGALLGDCVGVPYEFKSRETVKALTHKRPADIDAPIENKTYPEVPYGSWSDDGAHILALIDAVSGKSELRSDWKERFRQNMINWRWEGAFCAGKKKFDIGITTGQCIGEWEDGHIGDAYEEDDQQANGALMRTLASIIAVPSKDAIDFAAQHTRMTHNSQTAVHCSMYATILTRRIIDGIPIQQAVEEVNNCGLFPSTLIKQLMDKTSRTGTGWCISSLNIAIHCASTSENVIEAIRKSIDYGEDTDTNACITGMIAGAVFGCDATLMVRVPKIINIGLAERILSRIPFDTTMETLTWQ